MVRRKPQVRLFIAAFSWIAATVVSVTPFGLSQSAAAADAGSAVTVSGKVGGPFASLKVTVSQTTNLIDQVVRVSWTGGTPTVTGFEADYMQVMQCWSNGDATEPDRKDCEFGNSGDHRGGPQVATRQLDAGPSFADPLETQVATTDNQYNYVPFESATWVSDPNNPGHLMHPQILGETQQLGQFFDSQSTNEQAFNVTSADGTGEAFVETMTAQEAPGLGCGATTTDDAGAPWTPRCWLVVVPRGETEVNGGPYTQNGTGLATSPLSATNWAQRVVVPLQFNPLAISCPIGSPQQHTHGQEVAQEALTRWQAQLCKNSGTVYGYSKVSDDAARRQLSGSDPGLDFITHPLAATAKGGSTAVYAPLAVSAGVIAFNVDYTSFSAAALRPLAGERVSSMKLTPRLVAKLITQSYLQGAPTGDPSLAATNAPQGLTLDPDFSMVNPGLTGLNNHGGDVLMPFDPSDLTQQLWTWLLADKDASAFLAGQPDPWGMTVNPTYLHIGDGGAPSSFLKSDTWCAPQQSVLGTQPPPLCTLDDRPYASDLHESARAASRGDTLSRAAWSPDPPLPHYGKVPLQISGNQSVLAFTDAATAARYSLPVAQLENASGQFVAPDAAGLTAGLNAMTPTATAGVLQPNPAAADPAAYPLTTITYGATNPAMLSAQERSDFGDFIQYAATSGQTPGNDIGQLPVGYLPLPQKLVTQSLSASIALRNYVAPAPTTAPAPTNPPTTKKPAPTPTKPKPKPKPKPPPSPSVRATPAVVTPSATPQLHPTDFLPPAVNRSPSATTVAPSSGKAAVATRSAASPPISATSSPVVASSVAANSAPSSQAASRPVAEVRRTPETKASRARYALVVALALGGLFALSGPALLRFGPRRSR